MSRFWHHAFRLLYSILALIDPLVRRWWREFGIGNVVELVVDRRDGRGHRSRLVGLLRVGERRYLGHPNGHVGWTRDLAGAWEALLTRPDGRRRAFRAALLAPGNEREAAIRATDQHPFPGNVIYRLARRHVRAAGVFFRVDWLDGER
ncbi:MAG: hypothetical protein M3N29_08080 [Chloroflexota bacterium]|nr:hypothetical protein [Chloroflexota bacterium]